MAGRVRLAITGIQDQWLTGEPQFSYFIMNYRRHTRFATGAIESPFDGTVGLGETVTCGLPQQTGDLVRSMILKLTLPPLEQSGESNVVSLYNTSIGTRVIEYADLLIGGQTIERLTGEYIYMHNQLHNSKDDVEQTLYFLNGHGGHVTFTDPSIFYVHLPFYFARNPSLSIPTCAITKQIVEVRITFKPVDYKIAYSYDIDYELNKYIVNPISTGGVSAASLITDFFFVTEDEKNFLKTRPIEYVITQLQMATIPIKPTVLKRSVLLTFQHPVKEMMFVATLSEREDSEQPADGTVGETDLTTTMSPSINLRSDHRYIKRIALDFNEANVFDQDGTYLAYEQSLRHHTGCPSPAYEFYMYSFALKPEMYYPTGQVNMSRIIHKKLSIELAETNPYNETVVNVYALNYNVLRIESGLAGLKF
jgi:hypothetical protein